MVENLPNEIWKDVIVDREELNKYKGLYMVSNLGRVKNLWKDRERILKGSIDEGGYEHVCLYKDGVVKNYLIQRLVALAFIPNLENKPYVDHINTIKTDNRAENLRWVSQKENMNNSVTLERLSGANNKNTTKVICITTGREFDTEKEGAEAYNIKSPSSIGRCCRGELKSAGKLPNGIKLVWKYSEEKSSEFDMVENLPNEIWKDVIVDIEEPNKYKGLYMVSNLGKVKRLWKDRERILKGSIDKKGCECVCLSKDGVAKVYKINRLVALAFIPNPEIKPYVNHIDGNRRNNRAENLRWVSQKENVNNPVTLERMSGSNNSRATKVICVTTGKEFDSVKKGAEAYGIKNPSNITECCRGKYKFAGKLSDGTKLQWKYFEEVV